MTAPPPAVDAAISRLAYDERIVFRDLNVHLEAGRWTCILGRSGCGKSSLLRALAGLLEPAQCTLEIRCSDERALQGRCSYMAQQDLLLPWLDVMDNVTLGYRLRDQSHKLEPIRRQALSLLQQVGLTDYRHALPQQLSGGMRQRAAIVRTLMETQPLVLMDEPFSALDAITRLELQDLAAGLLQAHTILLITHDPFEALRLADTVYILSGSPAMLGEPLQLPGRQPRDPGDPVIRDLHASLIEQLAGRAT